jgi:hypothetical protein
MQEREAGKRGGGERRTGKGDVTPLGGDDIKLPRRERGWQSPLTVSAVPREATRGARESAGLSPHRLIEIGKGVQEKTFDSLGGVVLNPGHFIAPSEAQEMRETYTAVQFVKKIGAKRLTSFSQWCEGSSVGSQQKIALEELPLALRVLVRVIDQRLKGDSVYSKDITFACVVLPNFPKNIQDTAKCAKVFEVSAKGVTLTDDVRLFYHTKLKSLGLELPSNELSALEIGFLSLLSSRTRVLEIKPKRGSSPVPCSIEHLKCRLVEQVNGQSQITESLEITAFREVFSEIDRMGAWGGAASTKMLQVLSTLAATDRAAIVIVTAEELQKRNNDARHPILLHRVIEEAALLFNLQATSRDDVLSADVRKRVSASFTALTGIYLDNELHRKSFIKKHDAFYTMVDTLLRMADFSDEPEVKRVKLCHMAATILRDTLTPSASDDRRSLKEAFPLISDRFGVSPDEYLHMYSYQSSFACWLATLALEHGLLKSGETFKDIRSGTIRHGSTERRKEFVDKFLSIIRNAIPPNPTP